MLITVGYSSQAHGQAQELRRATDQTQTWGRGARGRRARATPAAGAGQSSTPFFFWKGLLFIARASRIYLQRPGARPRGHGELLKLLEPSRSCQCPVQTQVFRWDFRWFQLILRTLAWRLIQGKEKVAPKQAQELFCLGELVVSPSPLSVPETAKNPFFLNSHSAVLVTSGSSPWQFWSLFSSQTRNFWGPATGLTE